MKGKGFHVRISDHPPDSETERPAGKKAVYDLDARNIKVKTLNDVLSQVVKNHKPKP